MGTRRECFVEFSSPGTLFAETSMLPIPAFGDIHEAMKLAANIRERHGARPYGFRFIEQIVADPIPNGEGGTLKVESMTVKKSGTHYINGTLETYDDVHARAAREEAILQSNMRGNGQWIVCITKNGYQHTGVFDVDDRVVNSDGEVTARGDAPEHVAYRAKMNKEHDRG